MGARVLLLGNINSAHTLKLAKGIAAAGFDTGVFSLFAREKASSVGTSSVRVFDAHALPDTLLYEFAPRKLAYVRTLGALRRVIREFRPQLLHAHYATSYGLLGWLSGFHPFVLSAWGSDVLDVPSGWIKRAALKRIFASADKLMVTSRTLHEAVAELSGRASLITPFGVDTGVFRPTAIERPFAQGTVVFGAVKSLESVYRIDVLIDAFTQIRRRLPERQSHLLLVGDGTQRDALLGRVRQLRLEEHVTFVGRVPHAETPRYHNMIDVLVNVSAYEGFGVAVLEAMACGKPVIVSDTGGLAEIVEHGIVGFRVPVGDADATADAMEELFSSVELRERMGEAGRAHVVRHYDWNETIQVITRAYASILSP
jgi:glycosyltransferase involved in cell wall biosynthesis